MVEKVSFWDAGRVSELFIGRRIVSAVDGDLTLDDGTVVQVVGNDGCWGCVSGNYRVEQVADHDNVVTAVEQVAGGPARKLKAKERKALAAGVLSVGSEKVYRLFVYSGAVRTEVATIAGDDGNGYYGTGYHLLVKEVSE